METAMENKFKEKLRDNRPLQLLIVLCAAITFYMLLSHFSLVLVALRFLRDVLSPLITGAIIAYLLYPLVRFLRFKVFRKFKKAKAAHILSVVITVLLFLVFVLLLIYMLVPQLAQSVMLLIDNVETYTSDIINRGEHFLEENSEYMERLGLRSIDLREFEWKNLIVKAVEWLGRKSEGFIGAGVSAGKNMVNTFIALMLAIYILLDVDNVTRSVKNYIRSLMDKQRYAGFSKFCADSDRIFMQYFVGNLMDSLIIGVMCFIFMKVMRLPYALLVTVVVAITNFIPDFGPVIGLIICGFLILLVDPSGALWFTVYTAASQSLDANVIKPIIFGDTTGLSPLLVLASSVIGGGLFGVVGMLIGVPVAAIISKLIRERTRKRLIERGYPEESESPAK